MSVVQHTGLTLEGVVNSCFANTQRKANPYFMMERGWAGCLLDNDHNSGDYFKNLVSAEVVQAFN